MRGLWRDCRGGVLVETTVMLTILMVFVLGSVDMLLAMYQWNAASKAVQIGARLASVSDPVSSDLLTMTGIEGGALPGDPFPYFIRQCDGSAATCTGGTFSAAALNTIVYGRGNSTCTGGGTVYNTGMCDMFARIAPANVHITYEQTGLGYAGRPGGPSPTITVRLQGLAFQFYFLGRFFPDRNISVTVTASAEDMRSTAPLN
jgi:hypothetical protein